MARTIRQSGNFGRAEGNASRGPVPPEAKSSDKNTPESAPIITQTGVKAGAKAIDVKSNSSKTGQKSRVKSETVAGVSQSRERLVLLSMGLVSTALAAMLHLQFSLTVTTAALIGAAACAVFLLVNDQVRKSAEIAQLKAELSKLSGTNPAAVPALDMNVIQSRLSHTDRRAGEPERTDASYDPMTRIESRAAQPFEHKTVDRSAAQIRELARQDLAGPNLAHQDIHGATSVPTLEKGHLLDANAPLPNADMRLHRSPYPERPQSEPLRDQWALRPRDANDGNDPLSGVAHAGIDGSSPAAFSVPVSTIETDLALVQRKIKALADEVNATEAVKAVAENMTMSAHAPPINPSALESSIGALKSVADSMRHRPHKSAGLPPLSLNPERSPVPTATSFENGFGELKIPATAERIAISGHVSPATPIPQVELPTAHAPADLDLDFTLPLPPIAEAPPTPPINPRVAAITRAVETGRMDVLLSPIVGLMTHEVTHYDIKVRLKSETGAYFDSPEQDLVLAGSDVLALFDSARLTRAASLARRLDSRGKSGSLLSEVAGLSLTDGGFLDTFAKIYEDRERIAGQLVLTFSQADVDRFTPSAWQALSDMHAFGFRFALDRLEHLDVDFSVLAKRGFAFAKLDAAVLLAGMPARDRFVPVDEVCREIAGAGLTLIADAIDSEATRARLFGFGVLFGQGQLFGGGRLVSVDTSSGGRSVAA